MAKNCSECGAELRVNANFCDNCGSQIKPTISHKKSIAITVIALIIIVAIIITYFSIMVWYSYEDNALNNLGYSNAEYGFGFNPPGGWTKDTSRTSGAIVIFYAPIDDDTAENINVVLDVLSSGTSLRSYADIIIEYSYEQITSWSLISSNSRTVNGMNAYEILCTYTQGIHNVKAKQVIVEKNSKLIQLTYTAEIDDYNIYSFEFEQCLNSLKIV